MPPKILVVDDQDVIRLFLCSRLAEHGYEVAQAATGAAALAVAAAEDPDLVLLDIMLPDMNGMEVLERLQAADTGASVVILTSYGETDAAVRAMRLRAFDYATKPINLDRLLQVVAKGVKAAEDRRVDRLGDPTGLFAVLPGAVPSGDEAMRRVYATARKVAAQGRSAVLIEGESGVGKDILAQLIHRNSPRRDNPFLEINCASLPESLLESEMFGHERGAFTDAVHQKLGLLELTNSGTLFLDEIGEMSLPIQVKLLRVLEKMNFRRVGGLQDITVDVQVIAATNRDLAAQVSAGLFREDLYFRLKVVRLLVPPLRQRRPDILPLAEHFRRRFNSEFGKQFTGFTAAAREALVAHDWPGNIRELRNAVERAVLLEEDTELAVETLDLAPGAASDPLTGALLSQLDCALREPLPEQGVPLDRLVAALESALVRKAMAQAGDNQSLAARLLQVKRDRLRYRLRQYGIVQDTEEEA